MLVNLMALLISGWVVTREFTVKFIGFFKDGALFTMGSEWIHRAQIKINVFYIGRIHNMSSSVSLIVSDHGLLISLIRRNVARVVVLWRLLPLPAVNISCSHGECGVTLPKISNRNLMHS